MSLFSGAFKDLKFIHYRENFDSYSHAIITVFQVMCNSAWQHILYLAMNSNVSKIISTLYLISWILIGNYVFLNLFLAIMLDEFFKESEISSKNVEEDSEEAIIKKRINFLEKINNDKNNNEESPKSVNFMEDEKKESKIKKFCQTVIKFQYFEHIMQIIVILSCFLLVLETYMIEDSQIQILNSLDITLNAIFFLEFLINVGDKGLILEKSTYLRNNWNLMDFIILILSSLDSVWRFAGISYNKVI